MGETHANTAAAARFDGLEVGYDIPALPGMTEAEIQTPCLILDMTALERNLRKLGDYVRARGMRHRAHGKMHKSVDVLKRQIELGGAVGVCCQKVSEAEVFARAGIRDILVSNQVRNAAKIDRLARLPRMGAEVTVCLDDPANVAELSAAALRHGTELRCFVELDCGGRRCGVETPEAVVEIARAIAAAPGLIFDGVQAYDGPLQHIRAHAERVARFAGVKDLVSRTVAALTAAGLAPRLVSGGGSGSYDLEAGSGVYNELQCGSYAFMDVDYGQVRDAEGAEFAGHEWHNALFLLTSVMSHAKPGMAICDAGLKSQSVDSGLPTVFGRDDVRYVKCTDEHGVLDDPDGVLGIDEKLRLVPGHCDPTCNIHDWYVCLRDGRVEDVWPVSARGKAY